MNEKFEIEIYGTTVKFENSLKGVNTALASLKKEAASLNKALRLDPGNADLLAKKQANLQKQLQLSEDKAESLKKELSGIDTSTKTGAEKFIKLTSQIKNAESEAVFLKKQLATVGSQLNPTPVSRFKTALSSIGGVFSSIAQKAGQVGSSITGAIGGAIKQIGIGALRELGASLFNGIKTGISDIARGTLDTQSSMIALKNVMVFKGNGAEFDSLSKKMQDLASATNANTADTMNMASTLIGLGVSADEASNHVEGVVKANQAFGGSSEALKSVAMAYNQMNSSGKVTAENMNQLSDANTALGAALKDQISKDNPKLIEQYGSLSKAMEEGAVTTDMLNSSMGKIGGSVKSGVQTIPDALSGLKENISNQMLPILDEITQPVINGIEQAMPIITKFIDDTINLVKSIGKQMDVSSIKEAFGTIGTAVQPILAKIGPLITEIVNLIVSLIPVIAEIFAIIAPYIADLMTALTGILPVVTDVFGKIADFLKANSALLQKLVPIIASVVVGFMDFKKVVGVFMAVKNAFTVLTTAVKVLWAVLAANPFIAIAADIIALIVVIIMNWEKIKPVVMNVVNAIIGFFKGLWDFIVEMFTSVGQFISDVWQMILNVINTVINSVISFIQGLWHFIVGIFNAIQSFISLVWQVISNVINFVINRIINFIQNLWHFIVSIFTAVQSFISSVWQAISAVVSGVINSIVSFIQGLYNNVVSIFNNIKTFVSDIWEGIKTKASEVFNSIKNSVQGVADSLSSAFQTAIDKVTGAMGGIWDTLSGVWGKVSDIFGKIKGFFGSKLSLDASVNVSKKEKSKKGSLTASQAGFSSLTKIFNANSNTSTQQTFNLSGVNYGDMTDLARRVRREFQAGRA